MLAWESNTPSKLEQLFDPLFEEKKIHVFIKREDLLHPLLSGNKFRKLKHNILSHDTNQTLITFGGAYSNHLYSFSAACKIFNFNGLVIVRGDGYDPKNPTLKFAKACGVELQFVSRETYKLRNDETYLEELKKTYQTDCIIPEGGTNERGVLGCAEMASEIPSSITHLLCAVGSGGTIAGIHQYFKNQKKAPQILGIPALKNPSYLKETIAFFSQKKPSQIALAEEYHFGGYAKTSPELIEFIETFWKRHQILLDPVYTAKVAYALYDLIRKNQFPENSQIVMIHTGGLQGWNGMFPILNKKNYFSNSNTEFINRIKILNSDEI